MESNFSDINTDGFLDLLMESKNPSLLCGNGLSINFEPELSLKCLGQNMYKTHEHIMNFASYKVTAPKMKQAYLPNYTATIKHLRKTIRSEVDFNSLF